MRQSAVFKILRCPFAGCPQHQSGSRGGVSTKTALVNHIKISHKNHTHLADLRLCQEANVHICGICACSVYGTKKKLEQHFRASHPNQRTESNTDLCSKHFIGELPLNYDDKWSDALQYIMDNLQPDPATFRAGLMEKNKRRAALPL